MSAEGQKGIKRGGKRVLTPGRYIVKDLWRNRSRSIFSMSGMAALAFLIVIFSSIDAGLEDYFRGRVGEPTEEEKELFEVKRVMDHWTYLVAILCTILFALIVTNTASLHIMERRFEIATLRAIGLSHFEVSALMASSMLLLMAVGTASGAALGAMSAPFLDEASLSIGGGGLGIPLLLDASVIALLGVIVVVAGLLGMLPPLIMMNRKSPHEVLRDV